MNSNIREIEFKIEFSLATYDRESIDLNAIFIYMHNQLKEYFQEYGAVSPIHISTNEDEK